MRHGAIAALIATIMVTVSVACATAQLAAGQQTQVTVSELTAKPGSFEGTDVKVIGKLTSEGNYFSRSRKFLLVDDDVQERRVEVTAWLPLSAPPPRSDTDKQPTTMADYLDKRVELRGCLRRRAESPREWRFEVKSARIVSP